MFAFQSLKALFWLSNLLGILIYCNWPYCPVLFFAYLYGPDLSTLFLVFPCWVLFLMVGFQRLFWLAIPVFPQYLRCKNKVHKKWRNQFIWYLLLHEYGTFITDLLLLPFNGNAFALSAIYAFAYVMQYLLRKILHTFTRGKCTWYMGIWYMELLSLE